MLLVFGTDVEEKICLRILAEGDFQVLNVFLALFIVAVPAKLMKHL